MAYTRSSKYKFMTEWLLIGKENKNILKDATKISSETKKYLEFCKTFSLKQIQNHQLESHPTHPPL